VESGGRWQYCRVLAKGLFRVGIGLRLVVSVIAFGLSMVMFTLVEPPGSASEPGAAVFACLILLLVGRPAAVVVHESGHLLACLAFRVKVREFRIGRPDRAAYRFTVRGVTVAMGKPFAGQVVHDPVPSRWHAAMIVIAGSLANLVAAGVLLALGLGTAPPLSGAVQVPVHQAIEVSLAALFAATGISGLLPLRTGWGSLSDGARLLRLGSGRFARALRQDEMLQGPKGTIWRPANAEEAAEYQLDSAVLKQSGKADQR
jgi:peptidase M50-like protein